MGTLLIRDHPLHCQQPPHLDYSLSHLFYHFYSMVQIWSEGRAFQLLKEVDWQILHPNPVKIFSKAQISWKASVEGLRVDGTNHTQPFAGLTTHSGCWDIILKRAGIILLKSWHHIFNTCLSCLRTYTNTNFTMYQNVLKRASKPIHILGPTCPKSSEDPSFIPKKTLLHICCWSNRVFAGFGRLWNRDPCGQFFNVINFVKRQVLF